MNIGGNKYENYEWKEGLNGIEKLEREEKKVVIEAIPYRNFKEQIAITKQFYGKAKMEIFKGYVYIERVV